MKKLVVILGLALAFSINAGASLGIDMVQGNGIEYGYTDVVYGYTGSSGEIYPAYDPLISGSVSDSSGGFAVVTVDVDTDYPADDYYVGDFPNSVEFYIYLF